MSGILSLISFVEAVVLLGNLSLAAAIVFILYRFYSSNRSNINFLLESFPITNREIPSLVNITLSELSHGLENQKFTSVQLVRAYLQRIQEVHHEYHSIIETNPDALSIAADLDSERLALGPRGPLHGIPILLKDNIVTLDRMESTCGSFALVGAKPARESAVVTALRKSGAIILGKTNMAEWCGFRSTSGCSGWSARGGQCTGPFFKGMTPSGSSSGSAVATALGLGFAALGTETLYSIVSPAERAGVVGFKPSRNLIPSEGLIFSSERLDTVGILSRTVVDVARILQEIIRHSDGDTNDQKYPNMRQALRSCCLSTCISGLRIGIPSNLAEFRNVHPAHTSSFKNALRLLEASGADIIQGVNILGAEEFENLAQESKDILVETDIKVATNKYIASLRSNPQGIRSLGDLVDFIKTHSKEQYPQRNVAVLERALATDPNNELYKDMLERDSWFAGEGGIPGTLKRHKLDVLLVPFRSTTLSFLAAKAGAPCMSIPLGKYSAGTRIALDPQNKLVKVAPEIPFSMYIYGSLGRDADVLNVGYSFEQTGKVRETLDMYLVPETEIWHLES